MAAPPAPPPRRPGPAAHRLRDVRRDGHGGLRRPGPGRAARHRRASPPAQSREARGAHPSGGADRAAGRRRRPTGRSPPGCSSAPAPLSTTCARSSASLASAAGLRSPGRSGTTRGHPCRGTDGALRATPDPDLALDLGEARRGPGARPSRDRARPRSSPCRTRSPGRRRTPQPRSRPPLVQCCAGKRPLTAASFPSGTDVPVITGFQGTRLWPAHRAPHP